MDDRRVAVVVEDDEDIRELMVALLGQSGFEVHAAATGADGVHAVKENDPVLVTVDLGLPDIDGYEVTRRVRRFTDAYVMMLTARSEEIDTLLGLDAGADDYLTKPFSHAVLVARLRALVRRGATERPAVLEAGDLRLDPAAHRVTRAGTDVELTAREVSLLEHLLRHKGEVVSKQSILDHVWDMAFEGDPNIVEVYVRHLRNKLDRPFGREAIETVRGRGYRLDPSGG